MLAAVCERSHLQVFVLEGGVRKAMSKWNQRLQTFVVVSVVGKSSRRVSVSELFRFSMPVNLPAIVHEDAFLEVDFGVFNLLCSDVRVMPSIGSRKNRIWHLSGWRHVAIEDRHESCSRLLAWKMCLNDSGYILVIPPFIHEHLTDSVHDDLEETVKKMLSEAFEQSKIVNHTHDSVVAIAGDVFDQFVTVRFQRQACTVQVLAAPGLYKDERCIGALSRACYPAVDAPTAIIFVHQA